MNIKEKLSESTWLVERMPGVAHTISYPFESIIRRTGKLSWSFAFLSVKDDQLLILFSVERMIELGKHLLKKELENEGFYAELRKSWEPINEKYKEMCDKIDSVELEELSLEELKELYLEFCEIFLDVWTLTATTTNIAYYSDNECIPKILEKYGKEGMDDFITLSTPEELSFVQEEEKKLLKIAIRLRNGKDVQKDLEKHAKKYHYITNNYINVVRLDKEYFLNKIKNIENPEEELKKFDKEKRKVKTTFTKEEKTIAKLIAQATAWQDLRKMNNLAGNYYSLKFLKEFSKRLDYTYKELCQTTVLEFKNFLEGGELKDLKERLRCFGWYFDQKTEKKYSGDEALKLFKILNSYDSVEEDVNELKGITACAGKARGVVRVVMDVSKVKEFNDGDILIASMTRPEYTQLMKKAGAIVTNEGGVTCHAAIVSRELGKPCIIGTKFATKVLKEGDLVEVDADKGIVKILKND